MNNLRIRENSFRIEFGGIPNKPSSEEVHTFVGVHLGITRDQLVQIQLNHIDECAYVKVNNLSIAQKAVSNHDSKHEYDAKGTKYKLRIRMADGRTEVRLHDLSENVTDEQISRHMSAYGDIVSIDDLRWGDTHLFPGLNSGVKNVTMMLKHHIKSYITIEGESTLVTYPSQRKTCRHCTEFLHSGISCVNNKKLLAQKANLNDRLKPKSYAGVLRGFVSGNVTTELSDKSINDAIPTLEPIIPEHNDQNESTKSQPTQTKPANQEESPSPKTTRDVSRSPIRDVSTSSELQKPSYSGAKKQPIDKNTPTPCTREQLLFSTTSIQDGFSTSTSSATDIATGINASSDTNSDVFKSGKPRRRKGGYFGQWPNISLQKESDIQNKNSNDKPDGFIEVKRRGRTSPVKEGRN